jgi:hypothetical protein
MRQGLARFKGSEVRRAAGEAVENTGNGRILAGAEGRRVIDEILYEIDRATPKRLRIECAAG